MYQNQLKSGQEVLYIERESTQKRGEAFWLVFGEAETAYAFYILIISCPPVAQQMHNSKMSAGEETFQIM